MALTKTDLKEVKNLITDALADFYQHFLLPQLATKEDLNSFATKEDLERFSTKEDHNQVMNTLDSVLGQLQTIRQEQQVINYRVYSEHQSQLDDHEKRLTSLGV